MLATLVGRVISGTLCKPKILSSTGASRIESLMPVIFIDEYPSEVMFETRQSALPESIFRVSYLSVS